MGRPTDIQLTGVLAEIGGLVRDLQRDAAEVLIRARSGGAPEAAQGLPESTGPSGGGGGGQAELTAVERAADRWFPRTDDHDTETDGEEPANVIGPPPGLPPDPVRSDALLMGQLIRDAVEALRRADGCRRSVLEGAPVGRVNTVALCAGCGEPAPRVKRLDGAAYHFPVAGGAQCWWAAYRARSAGATTPAEAAA